MRPIRALNEVLETTKARPPAGSGAGLSAPSQGSASGTAASILREQGRIFRPRIVWVNQAANRRPKGKPRDKAGDKAGDKD